MARINQKKKGNTKCWWKWKQLDLSYMAGVQNGIATLEKSLAVSYKRKQSFLKTKQSHS